MMWSAQHKRKLTGYKMKDNSSERSRSHRVVGGGEDFFSQSDRSISLEGQLLQLHLFPSSREVHKRHIEFSLDNLNSPSLSCLIAHFPGDSYYFTSGEIHKRTTVRSTKTKSFVLKMDKAQKKGAKKIENKHGPWNSTSQTLSWLLWKSLPTFCRLQVDVALHEELGVQVIRSAQEVALAPDVIVPAIICGRASSLQV